MVALLTYFADIKTKIIISLMVVIILVAMFAKIMWDSRTKYVALYEGQLAVIENLQYDIEAKRNALNSLIKQKEMQERDLQSAYAYMEAHKNDVDVKDWDNSSIPMSYIMLLRGKAAGN